MFNVVTIFLKCGNSNKQTKNCLGVSQAFVCVCPGLKFRLLSLRRAEVGRSVVLHTDCPVRRTNIIVVSVTKQLTSALTLRLLFSIAFSLSLSSSGICLIDVDNVEYRMKL